VTLAEVSAPLAFAAGLASFLSPCVLPLVPAYLAYLAGPAGAGRARLLAGALGFVVGLSAVLILFFYALRTVLFPARGWLAPLAGAAVLVLALETAGVLRIPLLQRELRLVRQAPAGGGPAAGMLLGAGFGLGWTPCIGPTLGAVLTSGAVQGTTVAGLALLLAYAAGLSLPFVLLAAGTEEAAHATALLRRHRRVIDLGSAAVLAALGILLLTGNFVLLNRAFSHVLPQALQTPFGL
jgi:cytochrome c-type biogenesis protein